MGTDGVTTSREGGDRSSSGLWSRPHRLADSGLGPRAASSLGMPSSGALGPGYHMTRKAVRAPGCVQGLLWSVGTDQRAHETSYTADLHRLLEGGPGGCWGPLGAPTVSELD